MMANDPTKLEHFFIYLCGPIDFIEDGGVGWREELTEGLTTLGFNRHNIFNPCRKPLLPDQGSYLSNEGELMSTYRSERNWKGLTDTVSKIAHIDLRLVDKSDLVIAVFPTDDDGKPVQTYGTIHEIVVARQQQKPVFIVWEAGKEYCSAWLMWLVGHDNVFSSKAQALFRLQDIRSGRHTPDPKEWLFIDPKLEGSR